MLKDERYAHQGEGEEDCTQGDSTGSGRSRPLNGYASKDFDGGRDAGENLAVRKVSKRGEVMPHQGTDSGTNRRQAIDVTPWRIFHCSAIYIFACGVIYGLMLKVRNSRLFDCSRIGSQFVSAGPWRNWEYDKAELLCSLIFCPRRRTERSPACHLTATKQRSTWLGGQFRHCVRWRSGLLSNAAARSDLAGLDRSRD